MEIQDDQIKTETAPLPTEQERAEQTEKEPRRGRIRARVTRELCETALFAALITVCAYIAIPVGDIPITLQTFAVCLAAVLGAGKATRCVALYLLLGICGIPVFSGGKNFYALIGGASAGYVVGFLFTAPIAGFAAQRIRSLSPKRGGFLLRVALLTVAMYLGILVCYIFGTAWYLFVYQGSATAENLQLALTWCVYPYLLPDLVKAVLAAIMVERLMPLLARIRK